MDSAALQYPCIRLPTSHANIQLCDVFHMKSVELLLKSTNILFKTAVINYFARDLQNKSKTSNIS